MTLAGDCLRSGKPGANGLAMPFPVDRNGDGVADIAYGGDLKGNLWRFEFPAGSLPAALKVSFGGAPQFGAHTSSGTAQPITSAPVAANLSSAIGGTFIAFGTGRYDLLADPGDTTQHSIYGLWDGPTTGIITGCSALTTQTLVNVGATGFRDLSSNKICMKSTMPGCDAPSPTSRGWLVDLATGGERVLFNPGIDAGADLVVTSTAPGDFNACDTSGSTWFNRMKLLTGGSLAKPMFDTNNDKPVDPSDTVASSARVTGIRKSLVLLPREACTGAGCQPPPCRASQSTKTGSAELAATRCSSASVGPPNWRERVR